MLSVMSPVDGIGQLKGIESMVKCELPASQLTPLESERGHVPTYLRAL